MEIRDSDQLNALEENIRAQLQRHKLEAVLLALHRHSEDLRPFVAAGTALFAVRHCTAGHRRDRAKALGWEQLASVTDMVTAYLVSHPIQFDRDVRQQFYSTNPAFLLATVAASQWPYQGSPFGSHARPLLLFDEIPKTLGNNPEVPGFDMEASFERITGVPVAEFVDVSFAAYAFATQLPAFSRGVFDKARHDGLRIPPDCDVLRVLNVLAADPKELVDLWRRYKCPDRRFSIYDLNPLWMHPLVRPWRQKTVPPPDMDRMIAPLPDLIPYRMSTGVFYDMFNNYGETFAQYFGHVFQAYVGEVLRHCCAPGSLLSEAEIKQTYHEGKVPDWVIIDGSAAVLIECKIARMSRAALTTAASDAVDQSLKQALKGLRQLYDFREACRDRKPGLERFEQCDAFEPVLATLEPIYLANRPLFRTYIDARLAEAPDFVSPLPWLIITMDEIERLQPHLNAGIGVAGVVRQLRVEHFHNVHDELLRRTGRTYKDCFLYAKDQEIHRRLGLPNAGDGAEAAA